MSLLADSVDFLEDTSVNLLVFIALGWPLAKPGHARHGHGLGHLGARVCDRMASDPAIRRPTIPDVLPLVLASPGAVAVNGTAAWLLARVCHHGGSLTRAAFLPARNMCS